MLIMHVIDEDWFCLVRMSTRQSAWVETVASRMGKTRFEKKNRKQNLPPAAHHGNAPVLTQVPFQPRNFAFVIKFWLNFQLQAFNCSGGREICQTNEFRVGKDAFLFVMPDPTLLQKGVVLSQHQVCMHSRSLSQLRTNYILTFSSFFLFVLHLTFIIRSSLIYNSYLCLIFSFDTLLHFVPFYHFFVQ